MYSKIKTILQDDSVFYALLILLVGITAFGLGRWSVTEVVSNRPQGAVSMTQSAAVEASVQTDSSISTEKYVGSKNSSKYHLVTCPGAKQINEENKVFFASEDAAKSAGYSRAGNCTF